MARTGPSSHEFGSGRYGPGTPNSLATLGPLGRRRHGPTAFLGGVAVGSLPSFRRAHEIRRARRRDGVHGEDLCLRLHPAPKQEHPPPVQNVRAKERKKGSQLRLDFKRGCTSQSYLSTQAHVQDQVLACCSSEMDKVRCLPRSPIPIRAGIVGTPATASTLAPPGVQVGLPGPPAL
jgi:hypothetical protein